MSASNNLNLPYSTKLVGLDKYFNEMTNLYEKKKFPKVLLLNGKKGIGKFTLIMHFINYVYSKNEPTLYDTKKKFRIAHTFPDSNTTLLLGFFSLWHCSAGYRSAVKCSAI